MPIPPTGDAMSPHQPHRQAGSAGLLASGADLEAAIASRDAEHGSPCVRVLPGRGIPPALPRKAWPPRPRSHHPVNGPPGRPRRSAYQSCVRTATALTVSGRSQPRLPRHREGPVESQSGERPGGSRRIAPGSPRRAWPVVPGSVTVAVAVVGGATIHRAGGDHASTRPREPATTAGRASQHSQARQSQT
jgi:hypothetical protein